MADERIKKSGSTARRNRAMSERIAAERNVSEEERIEMFRQQFFQSALPDLPEIPGYHCCWLTTSNPRDSIHQRIRLGYEPIRAEDVPGWDFVSIKTGEYEGCIGVNEMVAFKLPLSLYQAFMEEAHHNRPLSEEEKLKDTTEFLQEQARQSGGKVLLGEGTQNLVDKRLPRFD